MSVTALEMDPERIAKWVAIVFALPVALVVVVSAAWSLSPIVILAGLLGFLWQVGPVAIAWLLARKSATRRGAWAFVALEFAILGFSAWIWYLLLVVDPDAQGPIALFIFVPLYEYAAVGVFVLLATLLGWRSRDRAGLEPPAD